MQVTIFLSGTDVIDQNTKSNMTPKNIEFL